MNLGWAVSASMFSQRPVIRLSRQMTVIPVCDQPITEVGSDEASSAGHQTDQYQVSITVVRHTTTERGATKPRVCHAGDRVYINGCKVSRPSTEMRPVEEARVRLDSLYGPILPWHGSQPALSPVPAQVSGVEAGMILTLPVEEIALIYRHSPQHRYQLPLCQSAGSVSTVVEESAVLNILSR